MCCIAPGCTSNYWGEVHFTTVFCFPKDIEVRDKCFRAIPGPREDYQSNKNPKVCILHFREEFIERTFEYFDGQKMVVTLRDRLILTKNAVPTIFPNCPSYLTNTTENMKRKSRDDKELTMVQTGINLSILEDKSTTARLSITILNDIIDKLSCINLSNGWLVHKPDTDTLFFLKINMLNNQPRIQCSLVIDKGLLLNAFDQHKCQIYLSLHIIDDIRQIEALLVEIETFCRSPCYTNSKSIQCSVKQHVENAILELENAIGIIEQTDKEIELDESRIENLSPKIGCEFLLDQLKYLIVPKDRRRYSITTQVFALKVHDISPACFRLIQFSSCLNF